MLLLEKSTTAEYWEIKDKYPDWPDILKKTERMLFLVYLKRTNTLKKYVYLVVLKIIPDDYDPQKENIIQQITKPYNYKNCNYKKGDELKDTKQKQYQDFCETKCEYISNATTILKACHLGLLPDSLDNLLNNGQSLFLNKTETSLIDNSNLFLIRRGIVKNKITNILDSIANILEVTTNELILIMY